MSRSVAIVAGGILAGIAVDILAAYIYLGCMDSQDWP